MPCAAFGPGDSCLFVRLSATDWKGGGWTLDSVKLVMELRGRKVDLIDCSSNAVVPDAKMQIGPAYQVPFAERIKRGATIPINETERRCPAVCTPPVALRVSEGT